MGAYYHDIGKTVRPEYFVENQIYVDNPHDRLSPNLSKLAITAHVRDGEHLAKLYGLPEPVVDIIKQHHGTSVLAFFYHKAQEASKEPVYEESYRYEEQKPQSKEAAIIMLADGVEAAVRALQNPTRRKIQGVIQEIIKQRVQDGQLDESDSHPGRSAQDPGLVRQSLRGLVGHRIAYPEPAGGQDPGLSRLPETTTGETLLDGPAIGRPETPLPPAVARPRVPPSAAALRSRRTSQDVRARWAPPHPPRPSRRARSARLKSLSRLLPPPTMGGAHARAG